MFRIAIATLVAGAGVCLFAAPEKNLKPGEHEIYTQILQDLRGNDGQKALSGLDRWSRDFPDSEYLDERTALYAQGYALTNQPGKVLDISAPLVGRGVQTVFSEPSVIPLAVRVLYNAVWAVVQPVELTPSQLATGAQAAREMQVTDRAPEGVTPQQWSEARAEMRSRAAATLLHIAMRPGAAAMAKQPPDCVGATAAYAKALAEFPNSAAVSWELGRSLTCQAKSDPQKQVAAIFHYVRAVEVDATLGEPKNDVAKIRAFATNSYVRLHGSEEGLQELRAFAKSTPVPPDGFRIETATEIENRDREIFEKEHPQLALWLRIREMLRSPDGPAAFENQMKDATVPKLSGTIMQAKPTCNPKELLVDMGTANGQAAGIAEVKLVFARPLPGRVETGQNVQWEGTATAFVPHPFVLTIEVESTKMEGLQISPCSPPPRRR